MAVQPIRLFGDPVLRTPAVPVVDFDKELRRLVSDLTDTMLEAPGAASIVSVRSATSRRSSLSKSATGTAGVRSTGSPNRRMGWTGTARLLAGRVRRAGATSQSTEADRSLETHRVHLDPHRRLLAGRPDALHLPQGAGQRRTGGPGHPDYRAQRHRLLRGRRPR